MNMTNASHAELAGIQAGMEKSAFLFNKEKAKERREDFIKRRNDLSNELQRPGNVQKANKLMKEHSMRLHGKKPKHLKARDWQDVHDNHAMKDPHFVAIHQSHGFAAVDDAGTKEAAWTDAHQGRAVQKRFGKIKKDLNRHGVMIGGHKRISFPKHHFSHDDMTKHLGMTKVKIAVPEAGQKEFTTYRHHNHNYHVHDHDSHWTMHRDDHPAATMVMHKIKLDREKAKADKAKRRGSAAPKGIKSKVKAGIKDVADSVHHAGRMAHAVAAGAPHVVTEGVPGAYYYAKGRATGAKSTAETVWRAQGGRMRKKYKGWAKSRKAKEEEK
jgi:hypothetical protein